MMMMMMVTMTMTMMTKMVMTMMMMMMTMMMMMVVVQAKDIQLISRPCSCKTVHPAGCMLLDMACPYFCSAPSTSDATVGYF